MDVVFGRELGQEGGPEVRQQGDQETDTLEVEVVVELIGDVNNASVTKIPT